MSGKKARLESAIRRRSLSDSKIPHVKETTSEQMLAWAEGIRDQFVRIGGQDAYDQRAGEILTIIRARSLRDGTIPLEAAIEYEKETSRRTDMDNDYRVVLGALILAVSFLEYRP